MTQEPTDEQVQDEELRWAEYPPPNLAAYRAQLGNLAQALRREREKVKELETVLSAWHNIFGTSQLSHASEKLRVAEDQCGRNAFQAGEYANKIKDLSAQVAVLREALGRIANPQCGCRPKCQCLEPGQLAIFREWARDLANEALSHAVGSRHLELDVLKDREVKG